MPEIDVIDDVKIVAAPAVRDVGFVEAVRENYRQVEWALGNVIRIVAVNETNPQNPQDRLRKLNFHIFYLLSKRTFSIKI